MKKIIGTLLFFLFFLSVIAQTNNNSDVVLKINGDEMVGKVTEINDADIKFVYKGETLVYTIKKADILKITYASGRIEFINKPALPSQTANTTPGNANPKPVVVSGLGDHHNKVAILPFSYLIDKQDAGEQMTYAVQNEAFSFLSKHAGMLELQSTNTTNALLIKAGVNSGNIRGFTMGEICDVLGVEFVLQGSIRQDKTSASNISSGSSTVKLNNNNNKNVIGSINGRSSYSGYSTSVQNYSTSVTMSVFNDKGENLFSQDHQSFWSSDNAYKITLQYLLKRTPLYKK
ncbi:hypothetical protein [Sediminibacterium goheungense]|uniref:Uncharacterized protein n=1 Tax=Sediminibacterium goheungense TaxID=1086393 RepID=A0A4R6ISE6_9BACT|nr:hypothetical protein [Sediminibacterium goheungense]TDO25373.1 hypothetical protein BC659_2914 [Sediminibacterium goheungense]